VVLSAGYGVSAEGVRGSAGVGVDSPTLRYGRVDAGGGLMSPSAINLVPAASTAGLPGNISMHRRFPEFTAVDASGFRSCSNRPISSRWHLPNQNKFSTVGLMSAGD
jgi:hypothetical protein